VVLTPGTRLGAYEINTHIGAGGMGEVYRATDTKLKRHVAIKILPPPLAGDHDRLARFRREAEVLASLNHPHIAGIYGVEESGDVFALVMELVEGEDLSQRISRGAIPLDEALPIAKQIADALEAAHEQGVVHRDLKPANIKVREDGTVKVLDFGLAKFMEATVPATVGSLTQSPTITTPAMTMAGVILGTAAYMSPEQAKGRPADKRSDIWAFGCVLYEMLTGKRAFDGEDVSDALAAVLRADPDWTLLPAATTESVRAMVKGCLDKDRKRRIGDIAVPLFVLGHPSVGASAKTAGGRDVWRYAVTAALVAVVTSALVAVAASRYRHSAGPAVARFSIMMPEGQVMGSGRGGLAALSPDGSQIAYVASGQLRVRSMSEFTDRVVAGADGVGLQSPVFSPDGRWIVYYASRTLKRIATGGGAAVTLCSVDEGPYGITWHADDIVFGALGKGVMRVSASGGTPEKLVRLNGDEEANAPQLLPGGRSVLFTLAEGSTGSRWERASIVVQSVASGERKVLVRAANYARYVPTGHLVYAVGGVLLAVPFDLARLEVTGAPVPVIEGIRRSNNTGVVHFSFSDSGSLVYVPGPASVSRQAANLVLVDPAGHVELLKLPPGPYEHPRLSPDGTKIVFGTDDGQNADVTVGDLAGSSAPRRLTFAGRNRFPIWTPDGHRVTFQSDRGGDGGIYWQPADGSGDAERLTTADSDASHAPESWSPTGDGLLFSITKGPSVTLWSYSTRTKQIARVDAIQSTLPTNAAFSPDGRWVAYTTNEQGRFGLYARPFPPTNAKFLVSPDQGIAPVWSHDGRELYFNFPGQLMKTTVTTQPTFSVSTVVPMPTARGGIDMAWPAQRMYDIAADGRMLGISPFGQADPGRSGTEIRVVLNWTEELKQRVPTR